MTEYQGVSQRFWEGKKGAGGIGMESEREKEGKEGETERETEREKERERERERNSFQHHISFITNGCHPFCI